MQRKTLTLVVIAFSLLSVFLLQMSVTQAATQQQVVTPAAPDEPVLLEQPIRIKIRQTIPFTIALLPIAEITATEALTALESLTVTETATESAASAATGLLLATPTPVAEEEPAADTGEAAAIAVATPAASEELIGTDTLTAPVVLVSVPVTLEIELDLVITQTLTTTVPASVTVQLSDVETQTVPIEVVVAPLEDGEALVEIVLPEALLATPTLTPTEEMTDTAAVTAPVTETVATPTEDAAPLATAINGVPLFNTTVTENANLRAGPGTNFAISGQAQAGQTVQLAAISVDGGWYLLGNGLWIANFLVADPPANVPVVNDQILEAITGQAPAAATPEAPAATEAISPTVTVDANLRSGPGTEFGVIGGTVTGQTINIVGRNADGTWFRLDNGGWVFAALVANPPALASVPVVNSDGTPVDQPAEPPAAAPEAAPGLTGLLPTPTPLAPAATPTPDPALATYLTSALELVRQFDLVQTNIDGLLREASGNPALLSDANWATRVNAALTLLRRTSASVGELTVPTGAAAVQTQLETAALNYTAAATALARAVQAGSAAQLAEADALVSTAISSLAAAEAAILQAQGQ